MSDTTLNVRGLINYLEQFNDDTEVEVEVHFSEAGEAYSTSCDITTFSHKEFMSGNPDTFATIGVNIGFGCMSRPELDLLISTVKEIDDRIQANERYR